MNGNLSFLIRLPQLVGYAKPDNSLKYIEKSTNGYHKNIN